MRFSTFLTGQRRNTPLSIDAAIAALGAAQHALITLGQLVAAGLTHSAITKRVARGSLHRVHRGVYSLVPPAALSTNGWSLAAVLGAGERSFLSHESLAVHRGLWRYPPPKITVLSPNQRRPEGVLVHRYRSLDPRDVTTHDGIPATTIHRLFVDLSSTLIAEELTNVMYEAAFKGWLVEPAIRDAMARASGHHDLAVVDRALALHASGSAGLRSRAERAFLSLIRANDLPEPRINTHAFGFELDFHWPELKLAVEIDGSGHARPRARDHDGSLDTALRAAGFTVVRFADEAVRFRPAEVLTGLHERLSHD